MATSSAGGTSDQLAVALTVARGGRAYGPIAQTWTVAPARLSGTIYYNSYGTKLVQNSRRGGRRRPVRRRRPLDPRGRHRAQARRRGERRRRAVPHLPLRRGERGAPRRPARRRQLRRQLGLRSRQRRPAEHVLVHGATFPAVYPDGSLALTAGGLLLPLPDDTTPLPTTGLDAVTDLGTPTFSPDGKWIAFNPLAGPGIDASQTLYAMAFARATGTFSGLTLVATGQPPARPGWPAFFPDSRSIVFHDQSVSSLEDTTLVTRAGAHARTTGPASTRPMDVTPLDQLNGAGYLPSLPGGQALTCTADGNQVGGIDADHGDDVDLNYEPTVNPVASGGYAWVVFTSRRMYGNEATIPPFCSDPRGVDLDANITTKKLWVAAVDLTQGPGVDGSHPAFYLPGQELLAGNSRGFWVQDPCKADGQSCQSGDQCCDGYCEPGAGGALVCSNATPDGVCSASGTSAPTPPPAAIPATPASTASAPSKAHSDPHRLTPIGARRRALGACGVRAGRRMFCNDCTSFNSR